MGDIIQDAVQNVTLAYPDCEFVVSSAGELSGDFDGVRLQQVLVNLLANAAQYRTKGTSVKLAVAGELEDVTFSVANIGKVLSAESLSSIFSAMVQLPLEDEQHGRPRTSLGLGLFVARETVMAHGGSIDVTSDATDGTKFTVRIPRKAVPALP